MSNSRVNINLRKPQLPSSSRGDNKISSTTSSSTPSSSRRVFMLMCCFAVGFASGGLVVASSFLFFSGAASGAACAVGEVGGVGLGHHSSRVASGDSNTSSGSSDPSAAAAAAAATTSCVAGGIGGGVVGKDNDNNKVTYSNTNTNTSTTHTNMTAVVEALKREIALLQRLQRTPLVKRLFADKKRRKKKELLRLEREKKKKKKNKMPLGSTDVGKSTEADAEAEIGANHHNNSDDDDDDDDGYDDEGVPHLTLQNPSRRDTWIEEQLDYITISMNNMNSSNNMTMTYQEHQQQDHHERRQQQQQNSGGGGDGDVQGSVGHTNNINGKEMQRGNKKVLLDISAGTKPYESMVRGKGYAYFSTEFEGNRFISDEWRQIHQVADVADGDGGGGVGVDGSDTRSNSVNRKTKPGNGNNDKNDSNHPDRKKHQHDFYGSGIDNTTAPSEFADVALLTEVLEHVPNPLDGIREAHRILKTGGSLLVTSPFTSGSHQEPYHFNAGFSPQWYRYIAEKFGFRILRRRRRRKGTEATAGTTEEEEQEEEIVSQGDFFQVLAQEVMRASGCGTEPSYSGLIQQMDTAMFQRYLLKSRLNDAQSAPCYNKFTLGWMVHLIKI